MPREELAATPGIVQISATRIRELLSPRQSVAVLGKLLRGGFEPCDDLKRASYDLPAGAFLIMPSVAGQFAGIKIVTVSSEDSHRSVPRIQASYNLYDSQTLSQIALVDGVELTTLRTAAVSMLAIQPFLLSPRTQATGVVHVVVYGTGPQGLGHARAVFSELEALKLGITTTFVTRRPESVDRRALAEAGISEVLAERSSITVLSRDSELLPSRLAAASIVICATSSPQPLFDSTLLAEDVIVVAVGSHEPHAREVDTELCRRAYVIVEDEATALRESGDIICAIAEGALSEERLVPLKDVVMQRNILSKDRPIFFKSSGMSWEDLAVASALFEAEMVSRTH